MKYAIEVRDLRKRFGKHEVLAGVNLCVEAGQTFAFLGINGAGKSTTIRHLLGLEKPDSGSVQVLGLSPATQPLEVRRAIGYLAEDQQMFGWMTVRQTMRFIEPFYPTWDRGHAQQLAARFELPQDTKVRHLSKGQNVRLGLLLALAHRPKLVILDDPTLGLDPLMRKQLLRDVVTFLQGAGTTVFFSSHLLYEVEPIADALAILHHGHVIKSSSTEALRDQVKRLVFSCDGSPGAALPGAGAGVPGAAASLVSQVAALPGVLDVQRSGRQVAVVTEQPAEAMRLLATHATPVDVVDLNLDEIFEAYVIGRKELDDVAKPDLETVA